MVCVSCKNEHDNNFCPYCGERAGIKRITLPSVLQDAFSSITNMDKGILYNLKHLTLHPRQLITDYIKGKRKGINNPITFLIIATTIYIIIDTWIEIPVKEASETIVDSEKKSRLHSATYEAGYLMHAYLKYFWVLSVICLSTATKLMFGKYNVVEHLAINSFTLGYATLLGLIGLTIFKWPLPFNPFIYGTILITLYRIFKNQRDKIGTGVQAFFSVFLFLVQLFLILLAIGYIRTAP